jgi:hypothetical protein
LGESKNWGKKYISTTTGGAERTSGHISKKIFKYVSKNMGYNILIVG